MKHIYGPLKPPSKDMEWNSMHFFDQKEFDVADDGTSIGLGRAGLIYVPKACANDHGASTTPCPLHVALHGCENPFVMEYPEAHKLSFNRWAESNGIVVLWPHMNSHGTTAQGKHGCWVRVHAHPTSTKETRGATNKYSLNSTQPNKDGYGSVGASYDTRNGPQMKAIRRMIEKVSGVSMV